MYKILFIFNILTLSVYAQSELYSENEELKNALNQNMYEPNYFSLLFGLFLVIGLIYLTGFIYQKLVKVQISESSNDVNKIDLISSISLGQGKNLHIIKLNGTYSLIGATQHNITHIKDYTDNDINKFLKEKNDTNC